MSEQVEPATAKTDAQRIFREWLITQDIYLALPQVDACDVLIKTLIDEPKLAVMMLGARGLGTTLMLEVFERFCGDSRLRACVPVPDDLPPNPYLTDEYRRRLQTLPEESSMIEPPEVPWKYNAKKAWTEYRAASEAQEADRKANRIERAKEELEAALKVFSVPVNRDDIRIEDLGTEEDQCELPFVTVDGVEFTLGPSRQPHHGGGLGIVSECPKCHQRVRSVYIYDEKILGQQLIQPDRVSHVCKSEDDKADDDLLARQLTELDQSETAEDRLLSALREMIDEGAHLRMQEGL